MSEETGLENFTDIELMTEFYRIMVKWNLFIMAPEVLTDVEYMNVSQYLLARQLEIKEEVKSRLKEHYDDRWDYLLDIIKADFDSSEEGTSTD